MRALAIVMLAGCSNVLGIQNLHTIDAANDGLLDSVGTVVLSGSVKSNIGTHIGGASLDLVDATSLMTLASATADSNGAYSLPITNPPAYLFARATSSGWLETDQFFAAPLVADTMQTIFMLDQTTLDKFATDAQQTQSGSNGFLFAIIQDTKGVRIQGATLTGSGGTVRYFDPVSGNPSPTATSTDASGLAVSFNVSVGQHVLTASVSSRMATNMVRVEGAHVTVAVITVP